MARESRLSGKVVAIWLALFFVLGLGLRIGMNVDASFDEDGDRYLYSGNDPYYHDRVVHHITETGESMVFDEGINYPTGAFNPNPPVYSWTTAFVAGILDSAGVEDAEGAALNTMVAVWGALTVFPVFIIASSLFNRTAGLWATFLMSVSAPHIQRSVWGFADHDATTMFFITLAMAFLVKGLLTLDQREYVKDWRHTGAFIEGMRNSFGHNKIAMTWSALAGVALSATALTWKGYPYVLAVMAVAVGLQLLWDHVKNKDSTAVWAFYLLPMVLVTLIPLPYYMVYHTFLDTTIWAGLYVLFGVVLVGLVLVPTRDLPSILVFPALALTAIAGLLVMLFVVPSVGQTIFTGLGYFEQTKLFTTIAEAQRSELGRVAASFGFFTFLLAFWGLGRSGRLAWKGSNAHMLLVSWGLVAGFMAFAATRFIMNAAPIFAILSGGVIVTIVGMLRSEEVRKRFRRQHGQNSFKAGMKSITGRSALGAFIIAAFLVLPNVWLGVDAAIPRDLEDPADKHLGAFGIDFDIKGNGWLESLQYLATLDQDKSFNDRPAFAAWWDYGHWATDIGLHPTVADPFQNHYNIAGRTLASESEQEAVGWMLLLLLNDDYHNGATSGAHSPAVSTVLNGVNSSLMGIGPMRGYDAEMAVLESAVDMTGEDIFGLYEGVMDASGKRIEYFGVDVRMYPVSSNNPGIFYAPAFLANKNPDDFIAYSYRASSGGLNLEISQYGVDDAGDSYRRAEAAITTAAGAEYVVLGGQAYPANQVKAGAPVGQAAGTPVQFQLAPTQAFYDSMYARSFGTDRNGFTPGEGMSHWRAIVEGADGAVKILRYYSGVEVSGRVVDDAGAGLEGMAVSFVDGFGASHNAATTDANGAFTVLAPFSQFTDGQGDLNLTVRSGAAIVGFSTDYQFTLDQAVNGDAVGGVQVTVARGGIAGNVFADADGNGTYDMGEGVADAMVSFNGQDYPVGTDGSYAISDVTPGSHSVTVSAAGYDEVSRSVTVGSGATADQDIAITAAPSSVTFTLNDQDGPIMQIPFEVTGADGTPRSGTSNGTAMAVMSLAPGDYTFAVDYEIQQNNVPVTYTANQPFTVVFGGSEQSFTIVANRA